MSIFGALPASAQSAGGQSSAKSASIFGAAGGSCVHFRSAVPMTCPRSGPRLALWGATGKGAEGQVPSESM